MNQQKLYPSSLNFSRFTEHQAATVLSWIQTERDRVLWSGNSFIDGLNLPSFQKHLQREDLLAFQILNKNAAINAYGEIILKSKEQATLCRIIVAPKIRGKGIGRLLCENLISEIRKLGGIKEVSLNTLTCNTAAMACYKSLGFINLGTRKKCRRIGHYWHDLIFMSLRLSNH